jgi:transposase
VALLRTGPPVDSAIPNDEVSAHRHDSYMQELRDLKDEDLKGLAPEAIAQLATQMLRRLRQQDSEIQFKDAKIEKITLQLARLKAWKFGAKTEAMSAEQRAPV